MMPRKLTNEDAEHIRAIHQWKMEQMEKLQKTGSAKALAEKFGVHVRTVEKVLRHEIYR